MTGREKVPEAFVAAGSRAIAAYEAEDLEALMQATMDCIGILDKVAGDATKAIERAEAERDALQAEVDRLRAWMPKWKRGSYNRSLWSIPVPGKKLQVWRYDSRWFWAFSDGWEQPSTDRDAAMRAAEAAAGLPQCDVANEP